MKNTNNHKRTSSQKAQDLNEYIRGLYPITEIDNMAFHFEALNESDIGLTISIIPPLNLEKMATLKSSKKYQDDKLKSYLLTLKRSLIYGQDFWTTCEINIDHGGGYLFLSSSDYDAPGFSLDTLFIVSKLYRIWEEKKSFL